MAVSSEKITFTGSQGEELAARLDRPLGEPRAYALFAHCFTCSKDVFAAARISTALAERGIAVFRFDFTGLGMSGGDFGNTNFSSNVDDLLAAADFMRENFQAPAILIGHSLGGAAILAAAGRVSEARAVATIGAPFDPGHIAHLFADARAEIESAGEAEVSIGGRAFRVRKQFLDDIAAQPMESAIGTLGKALLIFHAPLDQTVGIDNAGLIFAAARHPKSFVSLDDADHLLSRKRDAIYVASLLAAWASRYLGDEAAAEKAPQVEAGTVLVAETGEGKYTNLVSDGRHTLRADEPSSVGGLDTGMTPYGLLQAALGACTSMTLRMYAERKKWPLEKIAVRLKHDKIHAEDCAECETTFGKIDRIERELLLTGALDDGQRQKLLEIADKCPVHRTLESENLIVTSLAD
jgi:putative redox protein